MNDHIDMGTLRRYAAGALSSADVALVEEHLDTCDDGRCSAFLATELRQDRVRPRTFQSREIVWSAFESLAREVETSIDELVNAAMEEYAHSRGFAIVHERRPAPLQPQPRPYAAPRGAGEARAAGPLLSEMSSIEETVDARGFASALDRSYHDVGQAETLEEGLEKTRLRQKATRPPPTPPPPTPPPPTRSAPPPVLSSRSMPPSAHGSSGRLSQRDLEAKQLVLTYEGRSYHVDKERFFLGRSKTQSDLRLDDPNVSRQHAVIERVGAAWYVVDLGSTNGVQVAGARVARRALSDGDLIVVTTHEIRCSLR